jgi:hypothetical protein
VSAPADYSANTEQLLVTLTERAIAAEEQVRRVRKLAERWSRSLEYRRTNELAVVLQRTLDLP